MSQETNTNRNCSFIRWQVITIKHLTYSINLIIVLSVATLGYAVNLLRNEHFNPICFGKCLFDFGTVSLILSIGAGLWATLNRLVDFRTTTQIAKQRDENKSEAELKNPRDLAKELGSTTWLLFKLQLILFSFGFVFLLVAFAIIYNDKLF